MEILTEETAELTPSMSKGGPNTVAWTREMDAAFANICGMISTSTELVIPVRDDIVSLVTDASGKGLGAVLQVQKGDMWKAAAFYSRQTRGPERCYSVSELEALAAVEAIRHFSPYLYGREFVFFTDHQPLYSLMTSDNFNGRLKRFSMKLQPWMVKYVYMTGKDNILAYALSKQDFQENRNEHHSLDGSLFCERSKR